MRTTSILLAAAVMCVSACTPNGDASAPDTTDRDTTRADDASSDDASSDDNGSNDAGASTGTGANDDAQSPAGGGVRFPRALSPFADCSAFLDHVKAEAHERVGPFGLQSDPWGHFWEGDIAFDAVDEMAEADMAADEPASAAGNGDSVDRAGGESSGDSDGGFTGTNVQELGVDEPDIVKTDGTRILTIVENRLSYIDVTGDPVLTDTLALPEGWGHELFIRGDRALLFTNGGEWGHPVIDTTDSADAEAEFADDVASDIAIEPGYHRPAALIIDVDLSDPGNLRVSATMRIEGQYLSARAIDDRVRLAVTSPPTQLPWLFPQNENGEERAEQANRAIIDDSTIDDWLPTYELTADGRTVTGNVLSCERAHRPSEFSGFDMVSIVDLDLSTGLAGTADGIDAVGVMASGQTVYSSTDRMYVATTKWVGTDAAIGDDDLREWNDEYETDLHSFAVAAGEPTTYVASGTISGSLLNQFSLDEHDGFLRAITTEGSPWMQNGESETHLVVFDEQDDRLVQVGEVGGLGRGEQLFSARLMGDIGFAVTFRQIDPFYVLDLTDPTNPTVTGELKIPGFSTYLHPVGDDRVLGIGQSATEDGRTTGLKLSLFDVSEPADPREIAVWTQPDATSPAEYDHRAFQMFGSTAVVPVQSWTGDDNGAVLLEIGDDIVEIGRVSHLDPDVIPTSDCREIESGDLSADASELYWMVEEGYGRVQLCEPGAVGGWGSWYCDRIPVEQITDWFYDGGVAETDLAALGADDDDVIEMCWPDGSYHESILRSLVIGDTLWTVSPSAAQANALDGLDMITQISLR